MLKVPHHSDNIRKRFHVAFVAVSGEEIDIAT